MPENNETQREIKELLVQVAKISTSLDNIERNIVFMRENYVRRDEFLPVQKLVYGMVGVILITVLGWLLVMIVGGTVP